MLSHFTDEEMKGLSNLYFSRLSNLPKIKVGLDGFASSICFCPKITLSSCSFFFFNLLKGKSPTEVPGGVLFCFVFWSFDLIVEIFLGITALFFTLFFSCQPTSLFFPVSTNSGLDEGPSVSGNVGLAFFLFHCATVMLLKAET